MKRRQIEKQGTGDGLCGVYAIANYIKHDERFQEPDELWPPFWYLLEAMQAEGLLQPHYIWSGFETYHLKAIFDRACARLDLPYVAFTIASAMSKLTKRHFMDLTPDLFESGGGAVVGFEDTSHWFLVHSRSDRMLFVDDSGQGDRKQIKVMDGFKLSNDGLLLTRHDSDFARLMHA